jgi:hypothetical protein
MIKAATLTTGIRAIRTEKIAAKTIGQFPTIVLRSSTIRVKTKHTHPIGDKYHIARNAQIM